MLSDEQIAALTPAERRALAARLADHDATPSARWLARTRELRLGLMVFCAVVLVPWIAYLGVTLPHRYVADDWDGTWVGFDLILLGLIVATAVLGYQRRPMVILTAFATGTLLVCDAWFDVMTSNNANVVFAALSAAFVELPLAALLVTTAVRALQVLMIGSGVRLPRSPGSAGRRPASSR